VGIRARKKAEGPKGSAIIEVEIIFIQDYLFKTEDRQKTKKKDLDRQKKKTHLFRKGKGKIPRAKWEEERG